MSPFDYVNAITYNKKDLTKDNPDFEKDYHKCSFMVNRTLGKFIDTVFYANEMNIYHKLDATLKFQYLINSIRKKKRFMKDEKVSHSDDVKAIKELYGYSEDKARTALTLLTNEQIIELRKKVYKGGTRK